MLAFGCAVSVTALCWPGAAAAQEPDVTAWWSVANLGDPAPAPPAPPDVNPGDLFVEGSNTAPSPGAPVGSAPSSAQAVAGLEFELAPTDLVGSLTLTIDGTAPPQVSVVACRATERFSNVENGPWARVPAYDANACVPGALKDTAVVFADVGKLVQDSELAVVLLPGPVDRVVFAKPGDGALQVTHAGSVGAGAPAFGTGTGSGSAGGGGSFAGGGSPSQGTSLSGSPASTPAIPPVTTTSNDAGVPPVVASGDAAAAPGAAGPSTRPVAASRGLTTSARRWIALLVIALEVAGFAALTRVPDPAAVPLATAAPAAGGRLRPPDRWQPGRGRVAAVGGVGRFRRERHAPAPPV